MAQLPTIWSILGLAAWNRRNSDVTYSGEARMKSQMSHGHSHKALPWNRVNETGRCVFVKLLLREPECVHAVMRATVDLFKGCAFY